MQTNSVNRCEAPAAPSTPGFGVPFAAVWLCSALLAGNLYFVVRTWGAQWGASSSLNGFATPEGPRRESSSAPAAAATDPGSTFE